MTERAGNTVGGGRTKRGHGGKDREGEETGMLKGDERVCGQGRGNGCKGEGVEGVVMEGEGDVDKVCEGDGSTEKGGTGDGREAG